MTYVDRTVVPELSFPEMPVLEGEVRNADGTVTVPGDWIVRLGRYAIEMDGVREEYGRLRTLYAGEQ